MTASGLLDDPPLDRRLLGVAGAAGLAALVAGLDRLSDAPDFAFGTEQVLPGIAGVIGVTGPAAVLVLAFAALHLASAGVLARGIARRPAEGAGEWLLSAFATAVLRDAVVLGVLGGLAPALVRGPVILALDVATLAAGVALGLVPDPRRLGAMALRALGARARRAAAPWLGAALPFTALVATAWAAPVLLQLGSPVVPFMDVLPNHVAPVEHVRTFGSFDPLSITQSPIYGPSRTFLGYVAFFGSIAAATGLPAGLAVAAWILPGIALTAVAVARLARRIGGPGAIPFALLLAGMTTSFARIADVRATVVVLPIALWAIDLLVRPVDDDEDDPERDAAAPALLGLGLGAAVLLHPVVGALSVATAALLVAIQPERLGRTVVPGLAAAGIVALPQGATMLGLPLPAAALALAVLGGFAAGAALERTPRLHRPLAVAVRWTLLLSAGVAIGALAAGSGTPQAVQGVVPKTGLDSVAAVVAPLLASSPVALLAILLGLLCGVPGLGSRALAAVVVVGLGVGTIVALIPLRAGDVLGLSLRYEVPKTLYYWVGPALAIAGGAGLDALRRHPAPPVIARAGALAAVLVLAAAPLRPEPIESIYLGERRLAEVVALNVQDAGTGYWTGFPDSRGILDAPRREVVAMIRGRIEGGAIGASTPILHVAASFQQWSSTPIGVFAGVEETIVCLDAEPSIHSVGGRLQTFDRLADLLTGGSFPFVLLEPAELPMETRTTILAAGYVPIDGNGQGELFRRAP